MFEFLDTQPDMSIPETEYKRLLGYPRYHVLADRARELVQWARSWYAENGRPWIYARQTERLHISNERLRIDAVDFSSRRLHEQLLAAQAHTAIVLAVSAGSACEEKARQLWLEEKPDEYFFLETYGSAVVEHLVMIAGARLCAWAEQHEMAVLPHYSPGYPGWDISEQSKLLHLIRRENFREELQALDTGMLRPKKSLLAVFGITRQRDKVRNLAELMPCESCAMRDCQYRRKPHKYFRRQIEEVRQL